MDIIPHATRTSLRRLLLRKGVEMPSVRELTLRNNSRIRRSAYILRWRDSQRKQHMMIYYFCGGQPYLEVDNKAVPITMEEVQIHGLYHAKK